MSVHVDLPRGGSRGKRGPPRQTALSAHAIVADHADCHTTRADLEHLLQKQHDTRHTTLQVDDAADLKAPAAPPHCDEAYGSTHRSSIEYQQLHWWSLV